MMCVRAHLISTFGEKCLIRDFVTQASSVLLSPFHRHSQQIGGFHKHGCSRCRRYGALGANNPGDVALLAQELCTVA